jgi:hypothetical protein
VLLSGRHCLRERDDWSVRVSRGNHAVRERLLRGWDRMCKSCDEHLSRGGGVVPGRAGAVRQHLLPQRAILLQWHVRGLSGRRRVLRHRVWLRVWSNELQWDVRDLPRRRRVLGDDLRMPEQQDCMRRYLLR